MSPDYVPSLFAHTSAGQRQKNIYAYSRFEHTQQMKRKRTETMAPSSDDTDHETVAPSSTSDDTEHDNTMEVRAECMKDEHNYSQGIHSPGIVGPCSNAACQATVKALTNECARLRAEVHRLKDKVDELSLNEEAFKGNDDMVQELTGLPSYAKLMVVFTFLSGFLKASPRLTPFHSFLLTLMRMRLNLPLYFFVYLFRMSKTSVVRIFNSTLDVMYVRLSPLIFWPSKKQIQVSLPMCFRDNFNNCTSIIDCFEIFIEKPKNLRARAQTYSQYKHHNTVKYLISITPQGVISFVSNGWGGRTSDKHITENCGYLEKLSPGDVILADRGFNVKDTVGLYCAQLKIPAFTKGKQQLHPLELEATRGLAAVRIHVERVIGLVRNKYTILQTTIPLSLCQAAAQGQPTSLDKMVTVCCALCNICPSVVPTE